jgi:hypothetical protein
MGGQDVDAAAAAAQKNMKGRGSKTQSVITRRIALTFAVIFCESAKVGRCHLKSGLTKDIWLLLT